MQKRLEPTSSGIVCWPVFSVERYLSSLRLFSRHLLKNLEEEGKGEKEEQE